MHKKRKYLNAQNIFNLYNQIGHYKAKTGNGRIAIASQLAEQHNVSVATISNLTRKVDKCVNMVLNGEELPFGSKSKHYYNAAKKVINQDNMARQKRVNKMFDDAIGTNKEFIPEAPPAKPVDKYQALQEAVDSAVQDMTKAFSDFAEELVAERVASTLEENKNLREVIGAAKLPNWLTNLKTKFEG